MTPDFVHSTKVCITEDKTVTIPSPQKHPQRKDLLRNVHRDRSLRVKLLGIHLTLSQNYASRNHITPYFVHSTKLCIREDKSVTINTSQNHPQLKVLLRNIHRDATLRDLLFSTH